MVIVGIEKDIYLTLNERILATKKYGLTNAIIFSIVRFGWDGVKMLPNQLCCPNCNQVYQDDSGSIFCLVASLVGIS